MEKFVKGFRRVRLIHAERVTLVIHCEAHLASSVHICVQVGHTPVCMLVARLHLRVRIVARVMDGWQRRLNLIPIIIICILEVLLLQVSSAVRCLIDAALRII